MHIERGDFFCFSCIRTLGEDGEIELDSRIIFSAPQPSACARALVSTVSLREAFLSRLWGKSAKGAVAASEAPLPLGQNLLFLTLEMARL